jgi:dephospho-CoA kinase
MIKNQTTFPSNILVLVGMPGSGKSILAAHLRDIGYSVIRFGAFIIQEVMRRNLEITPDNEKRVREDLRRQYGMDYCARLALPELIKMVEGGKRVAIDGLYSLGEYETLKTELNNQLVIISIFTPKKLRYSRLAKRKERPLTEEEAEERDLQEVRGIEKAGPIALADFTLLNEGTEEDLFLSFDHLLDKLEREKRIS